MDLGATEESRQEPTGPVVPMTRSGVGVIVSVGDSCHDLLGWMPEQMVGSLTTVTTESEARTYDTILRKEFRAGMHWNTRVGPFVELLPASP